MCFSSASSGWAIGDECVRTRASTAIADLVCVCVLIGIAGRAAWHVLCYTYSADTNDIMHTCDGHLGASATWDTITFPIDGSDYGGTKFSATRMDCQHDPKIWLLAHCLGGCSEEAFILCALSHMLSSAPRCGHSHRTSRVAVTICTLKLSFRAV